VVSSAQIALALSLLTTSRLFIQSFSKHSSVDPGFDVENLLIATAGLPEQSYVDAVQWRSFHRELIPAFSAIPGVESVGSINSAPFGFGGYTQDFQIEGEPEPDPSEVPRAVFSNVSVGYHDALGLTLLSGRMLDQRDTETSLPVTVVNETLKDQYLGDSGALGQRIVTEDGQQFEVVGVVGSVAQWGLGQDQSAQLYVPYEQSPWRMISIVLRTKGDPMSVAGDMCAAVRSVDPIVPVEEILTMEKRLERSLWQARFLVTVMTVLGAIALILATVGVYGVVSYATSLRTREFGTRSALGAEPAQIARLVLREAVMLAGVGISLGLAFSAFVARGMQTTLYDTRAFHPGLYLGVALLLALATLVASGVPASRATRIDPMESLRVK
jgi:predicted permease